MIAEPVTFERLVDRAFNQIRQYARSDAAVTIHLLEAIATIATYTSSPKHRAVKSTFLNKPQRRRELREREDFHE